MASAVLCNREVLTVVITVDTNAVRTGFGCGHGRRAGTDEWVQDLAALRDLIETRSILDRLAERAADQDPTDCNGYCAILQPPDPSDACRPPPERKNL